MRVSFSHYQVLCNVATNAPLTARPNKYFLPPYSISSHSYFLTVLHPYLGFNLVSFSRVILLFSFATSITFCPLIFFKTGKMYWSPFSLDYPWFNFVPCHIDSIGAGEVELVELGYTIL